MIIGLTGKKGTGKSYCIKKLQKRFEKHALIKFADPLYHMQTEIYDIAGLPYPKEKDRKLLQWLGTEWGRNKDPNIWTNIWKDTANPYLKNNYTILCDDVRFDDEAELIRNMGGYIIKLTGPSRIAIDGTENHISERGIDDKYVDIFLENNDNIIIEIEKILKDYL